MITKQDWENALKQYEAMLVNASVTIPSYQFMIAECEKHIAEFKDDDPMPEDVKKVIKEVTK